MSVVKTKTRTVLKSQHGTAAEFMELFRAVGTEFFEHSHVAWWNAVEFDGLLDNLSEGHIVILEDFQMNYTHSHNNAVQGLSHSAATVFCSSFVTMQNFPPPQASIGISGRQRCSRPSSIAACEMRQRARDPCRGPYSYESGSEA